MTESWNCLVYSLFFVLYVNSLLFILVYDPIVNDDYNFWEFFFFFVEQTDNSSLEFEIKCLKLHADNTKLETELRDGNGYS